MTRTLRLKRPVIAVAGLLAVVAGCSDVNWKLGKSPPPEPPPRVAPPPDAALAGTVGTVSYLGSVEDQPVRGFGVVIGLGDAGSRDCPTTVREHLLETMSKEAENWRSPDQRRRFSAAELIESPSTAVVEVFGLVPPALRAQGRFDILVQAIPGTATRSLAGGLLLPCELHLAGRTASYEEVLGGVVVARAGGPVFVSHLPLEDERAAPIDERRGFVLSGGMTINERTSRLLLREPSYPLARRLERRINERFGHRPPTAAAMSAGYLTLHTPPEYAARPLEFLQLVVRLYLDDQPAFVERKLRELTQLVVAPGADYDGLTLAWEGIGRTAVAQLQPLYSHARAPVRLCAARAGLRLGDPSALAVVAEVAAGTDPALALAAVRELGRCKFPQAAAHLLPLLDSPHRGLRIAAYEGLLAHRHPTVETRVFPAALDPMQVNLVLDVVDAQGEPLIYVRRTRVPRIAVFGRGVAVNRPLFFPDLADIVTLNAVGENEDVTIFTKRGTDVSPPLLVPPRASDLIAALADLPKKDDAGRMRGVGLTYSQVLLVLSRLSEDGTLAARFEVERRSLSELLGTERARERPEADEISPADELPGPGAGADRPAGGAPGPSLP